MVLSKKKGLKTVRNWGASSLTPWMSYIKPVAKLTSDFVRNKPARRKILISNPPRSRTSRRTKSKRKPRQIYVPIRTRSEVHVTDREVPITGIVSLQTTPISIALDTRRSNRHNDLLCLNHWSTSLLRLGHSILNL